MTDRDASNSFGWPSFPSAKEKNHVQRAVTALLDALAPEAALTRAERAGVRIEQHRTPEGCVLQGDSAALSVSWFAESTEASALGELHIVVWHGVVSRRGGPARRPGTAASIHSTLVLHPVEQSADGCDWHSSAGARFDTATLGTHCLALLEAELAR